MTPESQNRNNSGSAVLVVRLSALGDVALTIPVLYPLCASNPDRTFVVLTKPFAAQVFVNAPANLVVETLDTAVAHRRLSDVIDRVSDLCRQYGVSEVADLHGVLRTRAIDLWARLHGLRVSVIDKQRYRRWRMVARGHNFAGITHVTERYAQVFRRLGFDTATIPDFQGIYHDHKPDAALFSALTRPKEAGERWIGIAPFAAHRAKVCPARTIEELVGMLSQEPHTSIFLFGSRSEAALLQQWVGDRSNVYNVPAAYLTLQGEMALMHSLDCMVAMDSANMHLAALAGTRVVSVWGATDPRGGFAPWGHRWIALGNNDMACRPCSAFGNKPCRRGDYACFNSITPALIAQQIHE